MSNLKINFFFFYFNCIYMRVAHECCNHFCFITSIIISYIKLYYSYFRRYMATMGEGWTAFRLQRLGQWNEANTLTFPKTTEIIRGLNIPLAVRGVMFAKQVINDCGLNLIFLMLLSLYLSIYLSLSLSYVR